MYASLHKTKPDVRDGNESQAHLFSDEFRPHERISEASTIPKVNPKVRRHALKSHTCFGYPDAAFVNNQLDKTAKQISTELPDWDREKPSRFWDPSRKLLLALRRYQYWHNRGGLLARTMAKLAALRHRFWSVVTGAEIPLNCDIGGGLLIPHPNGIVIHPAAKIGVNCLIFQQVTVGNRDTAEAPVIEGHVDIGAGARILGPVRIGAHAKVGANAVVLTDVLSGTIVGGIPAKVIGPRSASAQQ
jgi:serine O-acetyltransferase